MIWKILVGTGVLGLLGIRNALQLNATVNLYTALKHNPPPPPPPTSPPVNQPGGWPYQVLPRRKP